MQKYNSCPSELEQLNLDCVVTGEDRQAQQEVLQASTAARYGSRTSWGAGLGPEGPRKGPVWDNAAAEMVLRCARCTRSLRMLWAFLQPNSESCGGD